MECKGTGREEEGTNTTRWREGLWQQNAKRPLITGKLTNFCGCCCAAPLSLLARRLLFGPGSEARMHPERARRRRPRNRRSALSSSAVGESFRHCPIAPCLFISFRARRWGAINVLQQLDGSKFDVTVVSPRNYFLFTPLLPGTTTG